MQERPARPMATTQYAVGAPSRISAWTIFTAPDWPARSSPAEGAKRCCKLQASFLAVTLADTASRQVPYSTKLAAVNLRTTLYSRRGICPVSD